MDRDTKFLGFAKLLWQELLDTLDQMDTDMDIVDGCSLCSLPQSKVVAVLEPIIAQRAYDLVVHTIDCMKPYIYDDWTAGFESPDDVPDLTEWPPTD